jgi:hypothetical protein
MLASARAFHCEARSSGSCRAPSDSKIVKPFIVMIQRLSGACGIVLASPAKQMTSELYERPRGITAFIVFFLVGTLISFLAGLSLLVPSTFFEAMWRVNPRGHDGLVRIGLWAVALLFAASISCAAAAIGLWRRARWGHGVAVALIAINLLSDIANTLMATEPRAIIGIPIAFALLLYLLSKRVRNYFKDRSLIIDPKKKT